MNSISSHDRTTCTDQENLAKSTNGQNSCSQDSQEKSSIKSGFVDLLKLPLEPIVKPLTFKGDVKVAIEVIKGLLTELTSRTDILYCSGGFVRDYLLQEPFSDIDLTLCKTVYDQFITNLKAHPLVKRYIPVVGASLDPEDCQIDLVRFEINELQFDLKRSDFRTGKILEDIKKRDFTVNSLYINLMTEELIDPGNFQADISTRTLRGVDSYSLIFIDRNRLLRAIRFLHKGFKFEPCLTAYMQTAQGGARDYMREVNDLSDLQRLGGDLRKCICQAHYKAIFEDLIGLGLLRFLAKEKEALRGMVQIMSLMKDVFKTKEWSARYQAFAEKKEAQLAQEPQTEEFLLERSRKRAPSDPKEREKEELRVIIDALVMYFFELFKEGLIKKKTVYKVCGCLSKKKKIDRLLRSMKELKGVLKADSRSESKERIKKFEEFCEEEQIGPGQIFLLAVLTDWENFHSLILGDSIS